MRHCKKFKKLGRKTSHRKSVLINLAKSIIKYKKIITTLTKAKALRQFIEPILTKSKKNTTHSRRKVFSYFQSKEVIKELFDKISQKILLRNGGYTRIIRIGNRRGDNSEISIIELVDYSKIKNKKNN